MGFLKSSEVVPHFESRGFNSSHFVWLIGDFQFFLATNGLLLAFKKRGGIIFLALEPLGENLSPAFIQPALRELNEALPHAMVVWVSIYAEFSSTLKGMGYDTLPIGKEPWLHLNEKVATGKNARGVKSARNQAIRWGCKIEEWSGSDVIVDDYKISTLKRVLKEWTSQRAVFLGAFLNSTDPLAYRAYRRYFVGRDGEGIVRAYVVATLIPTQKDYFLEDLVLGDQCPRGIGELLILTACERLAESGVARASLGVVSGVSRDSEVFVKNASMVVRSLSALLEKFYNLEGMEVFRKRFQPKEWQCIHIAARRVDEQEIGAWGWLRIFWNLFLIFEPRLQLRYRFPHGRTASHSVAKANSAKLGA